MNEQIVDEASEWFVRLRYDSPASDVQEHFMAWLRTSPEHVRAYLSILALWSDLPAVDPQRELGAETLIERARADAGVGLAGPQAGIEPQFVAQRDVHGAEPGADRRRDRALERDLVPPDRIERRVGERRAGLRHHVDAGLLHVPVELDPRCLQDAARGLRQFGACSVAGNEGDAVGHRRARVHPGALRLASERLQIPCRV